MTEKKQSRKFFIGEVVSDRMQKTAVVQIVRVKPHSLYHKVIRWQKKLYADNTLGAKNGDQVKVVECRPLSKTKRFAVTEIIKSSTKTK